MNNAPFVSVAFHNFVQSYSSCDFSYSANSQLIPRFEGLECPLRKRWSRVKEKLAKKGASKCQSIALTAVTLSDSHNSTMMAMFGRWQLCTCRQGIYI